MGGVPNRASTAVKCGVWTMLCVLILSACSQLQAPQQDGLDPPTDTGTTRLGLHYTAEELDIWRERAIDGPYRTSGDVSQNSPGDWQRIVQNANTFLANPSAGHWQGQTAERCVTWGDSGPSSIPVQRLRDAAFYYLITGDTKYRDAAKTELLSLAGEPGSDFTDDSRWCQGEIRDAGNPGLQIVNWFTPLLFAYDYLGSETFSDAESELLERWFLEAAKFFQREVALSLDRNFIDRQNGDYRISGYGMAVNSTCSDITHFGGWQVCSLAKHYNNRRAAAVRFFGLAGLKFEDEHLVERAKAFVREFVMFSVYPDGVIGEFERWRSDFPDLGWAYASQILGSMHTLADAFARAGDFELYEFTTSEGAFGTEGGVKSLRLVADTLASYVDGSVERYGTDRIDRVGRSEYRIDGVVEDLAWYDVRDVLLVQPNMFYRSERLADVYTRTAPGTRAYPSKTENFWSGEWFIYPGVLFMWGQLENEIDVYGRW